MSQQDPIPDQVSGQVLDPALGSAPDLAQAATGPAGLKRYRPWLLAGMGGIVLAGAGLWGALFLSSQSQSSQSQYRGIEPLAPPSATAPAPAPSATEVDAEAEARRAQWQARQQQVQSVIGSMDRATLIGNSPTRGAENAPIVLLKFSDFQCPYCALASADMKTFTSAHEQEVLFVYKHLPLVSIHPEAMGSAKAAWAAGQQGQFWLYHDGLFAYQDRLGDALYEELATKIGLDLAKFNRDRNSPQAQAAIDQDIALARQLNLNGTPMFVMNDLLIPPGTPLDFFAEAVRIFQTRP
jgi:protein-disulfide isomerase